MTRTKSWTLTDVANDIWLDSFAVSNDSLRLPTPFHWSVRKGTLRGGRRDGIDLIEVHNGALSFSVLATRGMGLWRGEYRGNFLGWRSPVRGPVHPKYVNQADQGGLGWLTGFDEWLVRCGLASNGPPGEDVVTHKDGRTTRTPPPISPPLPPVPPVKSKLSTVVRSTEVQSPLTNAFSPESCQSSNRNLTAPLSPKSRLSLGVSQV